MENIKVTNTRTGPIQGPALPGKMPYVFQPGSQFVPQSYFAGLDRNSRAAIKKMCDREMLVLEHPSKAKPAALPPMPPPPPPQPSAEETIAGIASMHDFAKLDEMFRNEQRKEVCEAIFARLEVLNKMPPKKLEAAILDERTLAETPNAKK